jgi:hypothetical protein
VYCTRADAAAPTTFITATLATTIMPSLQQHSHPADDNKRKQLLDPKLCSMDDSSRICKVQFERLLDRESIL